MKHKIVVDFKKIDRKKHPFYFFYPLLHQLVEALSLYQFLESRTKTREELCALDLSKEKEEVILCFWYRKISYILVAFLTTILLFILARVSADKPILTDNTLPRDPKYVGTDIKFDVKLTGEEEYIFEDVAIPLQKERYTEAEFLSKVEELEPELIKRVYGENKGLYEIRKPLYFPDHLFDTGISLEWLTEYEYISDNGDVKNENLEMPISCLLRIRFVYLDYLVEKEYPLVVMPRDYSREEIMEQKYQTELEKAIKDSEEEDHIKLPERMEEFFISYRMEENSSGSMFLLFGLLCMLLLWFFMDREVVKENLNRQEQLLYDYPEMLQKLTLLISAGMTVRAAFNKILEGFQNNKETKYLYGEIMFTLNEIQNGISEVTAYEHMGRRIGLIPYLKLGTYLSQNLKKGSKGLVEQLSKEAMEALTDRKVMARQLGEKAGTKLLIPMVLMLLLVFIIIMYPAFSSMSG